MTSLQTSLFYFLLCFESTLLRQQFVNAKDDTSLILEQAFAQAGIPLTDYQPAGFPGPIAPPMRQSLLSRLRFPFISRSKNRFKLSKSLLPKPLKLDSDQYSFVDYIANHRYPSQFMLPPINAINQLYPTMWPSNDRKAVHSSAKSTPTPTVSGAIPPPVFSEQESGRKYSQMYASKYNYQYGFQPITVRTTAPSFIDNSLAKNRKTSLSKRLSGRRDKKYSNHQEDLEDSLSNDIIFPKKIVMNKKAIFDVNPSEILQQFSGEDWDHNSTLSECANKDLGWCDYSSQYPTIYVRSMVKQCLEILDRMYVEVPENLASFDDYVPFAPRNGSNGQLDQEDVGETWSWAGYRSKNNMLCDSERRHIRPSIAQDINGRWYLIVQTSLYHQKVPIEVCRNPGGVCNNLNKCSKTARCVQKFGTQLLISLDLDKEDECPIMKLYRFPSACVCDSANYQ
ncbi:hypothetical protein B4U80_13541 [Leptotrombidium deliense]|uniref:Spaetzle domain-containing protein n=1 Tax=Leptotrombidium deliense TaxID=299467 RepID=A0A443SU30_9ACAR|nr:hypothetical protein B4U80_13541 [Leptotrombidium deliense]